MTAAHEFLYANGGIDPQACVSYINGLSSLPNRTDSPAQCAAKVNALAARPAGSLPVGFASDRTGGKDYTDDNAAQLIATFMLVRREMWWFGVDQKHNSMNLTTAALLLRDDGAPLGAMTAAGRVFSRAYEHATVSLDCDTFTASWTPSA